MIVDVIGNEIGVYFTTNEAKILIKYLTEDKHDVDVCKLLEHLSILVKHEVER